MKGFDEVQKFAPEPARSSVQSDDRRVVDVLVLTALKDELDGVRGLREDWAETRDDKGFPYHRCALDNGIVVAAAWIGAMGPTSAMSRGKDLVHELHPDCLAMCGICAGDPEQVALGDLIVADRLWPYDEGKQVQDKFYHSMKMVHADRPWAMHLAYAKEWLDLEGLAQGRPPPKEVQTGWLLRTLYTHQFQNGAAPAEHPERQSCCPGYSNIVKAAETGKLILRQGRSMALTDLGKDRVDEEAYLHPDGPPRERAHEIHIGAMATGSSVIKDGTIWGRLRFAARETMALDMEGAAIAQLADDEGKRFLVVKAVQDFANGEKDDAYRSFGCAASAKFVLAFLEKHLKPKNRLPTPTVVTANRNAEQSQHIVLCAPRSLQAAWQNVLPRGTNPQLLVIETPETRWYWDEPRESPVWSSVFRNIEACADAVVQLPNRTLHVFTMLPYGFGAALGAMVLDAYRGRGRFVVYQDDYTTNAWNSWGPRTAPLDIAIRRFGLPDELAPPDGSPVPTVRDVLLVIGVSRPVIETDIERSDVPKDATWIRATVDKTGTHVIRSSGDIEGLVDWLRKLVDACCRRYPNASLHVFYAGPHAAFIRAGEHFLLCGRPITIYDRNRAGEDVFRFLPIVRFEAGRAKLVVGETALSVASGESSPSEVEK